MQARHAIEEHGFVAQDANVLFRANCPNIDLVVFGKNAATYVQIKSSQKPSGPDTVIVDGSTWSEDQLRNGGPRPLASDKIQIGGFSHCWIKLLHHPQPIPAL